MHSVLVGISTGRHCTFLGSRRRHDLHYICDIERSQEHGNGIDYYMSEKVRIRKDLFRDEVAIALTFIRRTSLNKFGGQGRIISCPGAWPPGSPVE